MAQSLPEEGLILRRAVKEQGWMEGARGTGSESHRTEACSSEREKADCGSGASQVAAGMRPQLISPRPDALTPASTQFSPLGAAQNIPRRRVRLALLCPQQPRAGFIRAIHPVLEVTGCLSLSGIPASRATWEPAPPTCLRVRAFQNLSQVSCKESSN